MMLRMFMIYIIGGLCLAFPPLLVIVVPIYAVRLVRWIRDRPYRAHRRVQAYEGMRLDAQLAHRQAVRKAFR